MKTKDKKETKFYDICGFYEMTPEGRQYFRKHSVYFYPHPNEEKCSKECNGRGLIRIGDIEEICGCYKGEDLR